MSQPKHDHSERVDLRVGALVASFLPSCGMLGVSLRCDGREFVALARTIDEYRAGDTTGIPLLHPWANRLRSHTYAVGDRVIDLSGLDVPTDGNGLPLHGVLHGRPFVVDAVDATHVVARCDITAVPEVLAAFPFPHVVTIECRLDPGTIDPGTIGTGTLTVTTDVHNTGETALPVSFGWHPFLTLPGTPRSQWRLRTPACDHHVLDPHLLPTGTTVAQPELDEPVGTRTYDDHYTLHADRTFVLGDAHHTLTVRFDDHYPAAQLYLPATAVGDGFVCIEPMTAATDAINAGTAPMLPPGEHFRAEWSVTVERT